jgi:hypothetical protein
MRENDGNGNDATRFHCVYIYIYIYIYIGKQKLENWAFLKNYG